MRTMREILARQDAARAEMRSINEAAGADGALAEDQQTRWGVLEAEITTLRTAETRQATLDDLDRSAVTRPVGGGAPAREVRVFASGPTAAPASFDGEILRTQNGERVPVLEARHQLGSFVPASEARAQELGLGGFLRASYNGPQNELERRVMAESSIGTGGALVPTPLSAEIIDLLRPRSAAFKAGARLVPMASQTQRYARVIGDPPGGWRAENSAIAESQPTFDQVTATAKSWALLVRTSRELLEDATNLDTQLRSVFASAAAVALDQAILFGTGTSNQPLGIANQTGVLSLSMGTNGSQFSWAAALDAAALLETANAGDITAMVIAPRTARTMYGLTDSTGQPILLPPRVAEIPRFVTTAVPINQTQGSSVVASTALIGDFREVMVCMRTALTISTLTERYADTGQVGFVVWLRADVVLARPAAMAKIVGIIP